MAYSRVKKPPSSPTEERETSLTDCSICLDEMENPKALPCLHSFCLKCLKRVSHPPGSFICPLCQEKIPLPPAGVDGFRDNFFIKQLQERKAIHKIGDRKVACACCGSSDKEVQARCMDCNGFLCQICIDMHDKLAPLRQHSVFTIEELTSGRVDPSKLVKEECCQKHKGQALRWFCRTCNIPICRDCTVMEHTFEHDYATLESTTEAHLEEIKKLVATCDGVYKKVDAAITEANKIETVLNNRLTKASKQLQHVESKIKEAFLKELHDNVKSMTDHLEKIKKDRHDKIGSEKRKLQNMHSKLSNAIETANQVMKSGSRYDIASNYATLSTTLTQLQDIKPTSLSHSLSAVKFKPNDKFRVERVDLGTISATRSPSRNGHRVTNGKWVLEKEIGKEGPGKIQCGLGVAIHPNTSDIYIADRNEKSIKVFDSAGNFKHNIQGDLHNPHDIAVSSDGSHFICDQGANVKVFSPDGTYLKQFPTVSPDGVFSDTDGSKLYCLTIDHDGNLLVGNFSMHYISKHRQDGTHISSFNVGHRISPFFIAVSSQGRILVGANSDIQVFDVIGKLLFTIKKPPDAKHWTSCGVCCSDDGIIYISTHGLVGDVYSFTEDGEYIGCVTTDVTDAEGIALIDDDRLVVVQYGGHPAKIFTKV